MLGETTVTLVLEDDPRLLERGIYASAKVIPIDTGGAVLATVYRTPSTTPIARLDHSLTDSPHEGQVLREVMLETAVAGRPAYLVWRLDTGRPRMVRLVP